jgi:hypothetical protein
MEPRTTFRFESGDVRFELSGSEDFVRRNLPAFLPFVSRVVGAPATAAGASAAAPSVSAAPAGGPSGGTSAAASEPTNPGDLGGWYEKHVPAASRIAMQDQILVFAFWMRGFRKFIFTSEDIRRCFETIGQTEPKSLLQILGTLKRDHNLILGTERRGEYMLNTTGIDRVRELLGIPKPGAGRDAGKGTAPRDPGDAERAARAVLDL